MKKFTKTTKFLLGLLLLTTFLSCFEDEDEGYVECNIDTELNYYYSMIDEFSANPNSTTCSNLKSAALDLIDAAEGCSDYDYYYEATEAWLSIDCSVYDDGDGNGGGGGDDDGGGDGGGGDGTGKATFWTGTDFSCGNISVYVYSYSGSITHYYDANPGCDASGCANFNLAPGNYSWNASCGSYTWSGTITVNEGACSTMKLTL